MAINVLWIDNINPNKIGEFLKVCKQKTGKGSNRELGEDYVLKYFNI